MAAGLATASGALTLGSVQFGLCWFGGELVLAGCIWRVLMAAFLVDLLHRSELEMSQGCAVGLPNKELVESLICRRISGSFLALGDISVVDLERRRSCWLNLADWVRAYQRRPCRWRRWRLQMRKMAGRRRLAAASSGRRAADLFPPGYVARWEAVLRPIGSHGFVLWRPCRPKWLRPRRRRGKADAEAVDLIAFQIFSLGSFLQSLGTCLYFLVSLSPSVQSVVPFLYE